MTGAIVDNMIHSEDAGAVLLVRVWFEQRCGHPAFRARITRTTDLKVSTTVVLATPEDVLDDVRSWLRAATTRLQ